jgi:hypothetical protein
VWLFNFHDLLENAEIEKDPLRYLDVASCSTPEEHYETPFLEIELEQKEFSSHPHIHNQAL